MVANIQIQKTGAVVAVIAEVTPRFWSAALDEQRKHEI
jgi:hypothetical protein